MHLMQNCFAVVCPGHRSVAPPRGPLPPSDLACTRRSWLSKLSVTRWHLRQNWPFWLAYFKSCLFLPYFLCPDTTSPSSDQVPLLNVRPWTNLRRVMSSLDRGSTG